MSHLINVYSDEYAERVGNATEYLYQTATTIVEVLERQIPLWYCAIAVLIWAGTGMGKTYFIIHSLLPYVIEHGMKMLIVSNRVACSVQQKREIMALMKDPQRNWLTDEGIRCRDDFGPVRVMTLQALSSFLADPDNQKWCESIDYLVVDECHFFTSDCFFNQSTGYLLAKIPKIFARAVRIYMTATPWDVLPLLEKSEKTWQYPDLGVRLRASQAGRAIENEFRIYHFIANYEHINVHYFRGNSELIQAIAESPSNQKWFVCVTNKQKGRELAENIGNEIGPDNVCMVTAEEKGGDDWCEIVNNEQLPCRVTLATRVLDNGVNIKDDALVHVVIYEIERTQYMQCLGRKRCHHGDRVNLYVPALRKKDLVPLRQATDQRLETIRITKSNNPEAKKKHFNGLWLDHGHAGRTVLQLPGGKDQNLNLNEPAVHKTYRDNWSLEQLNDMIQKYGDAGFPRLVHQWLGDPDGYSEDRWMYVDPCEAHYEELCNRLKEWVGKPISDTADQKNVTNLIVRSAKEKKAATIRADREKDYTNVALNNFLEKLGLPYLLCEREGTLTVATLVPTSD